LLTLREEVFENRVLKRIIGSKRYDVAGRGEDYIMRNLMTCRLNPHQILFE
jgi:hypothetical protein